MVILCLAAILLGGILIPWPAGGSVSHAQPAYDYAAAVQRLQMLEAARSSGMNPVCRVQLMTHGEKRERAIVLVHGYTSCPQQFHALGERLFDLGYNVLIAPLPHHGLSDRLTLELGELTAEELSSYADEMVDIAHGLGDKVDMVGISGGGVITAWTAQNRADLNLAVVVSPAFGFKQIPSPLTAAAMNLFSVLPESYQWWDWALQAEIEPSYAYPRYSTHALAQIARLGFSVDWSAGQARPQARRILVVTNGNEQSVNNELTGAVVARWREHGGDVATYEFSPTLQLPHDLIDPNQPEQKIDVVYPTLIELIEKSR